MDLSRPASAVVPSIDADVLLALARVRFPVTGRELARISGHSQGQVQRILHRAAANGLVDLVDAGRSKLYALNREHVAAPAVLELVDLRGRLFERIRDLLADWPIPPVAAAVFGSAARGDGGPESDIDLLVVRAQDVDPDGRPWSDAIADLSNLIRRWSGNVASVIQVTPSEVAAMVARGEPILEDLRRDGVWLTSRSVLDVARKESS
ncbi:MAG: polymerase beta domain protein region [Acidimicrobiaceae bacterium]|nr:polymerase beta domain protein region [Acidimicrobiaceae bacterium]